MVVVGWPARVLPTWPDGPLGAAVRDGSVRGRLVRADIHQAFLSPAASLICWRYVQRRL